MFTFLKGADNTEDAFAQRFRQWYEDRPPSTAIKSEDIVLLERYKPIYYLHEKAAPPIDFYQDYIARGKLFDAQGKLISRAVTPAILNRYKADPAVGFTFAGLADNTTPTVYGRIERAQIDWLGQPKMLTFLTYNLVFPTSGLPAGLSWWKSVPSALLGSLSDWHQLDHYVAVTIALDLNQVDQPRPLAVTFQQHNYQRSYRLGGQEGSGWLAWPESNRLEVDIAWRSNENYPHIAGRQKRRAASFMQGAQTEWLIFGEQQPLMGGWDITQPDQRFADLKLRVLPHDDAFYTFSGTLGKRRILPGRNGPPGADYNTLPAFKAPEAQLYVSYWYEGMAEYPNEADVAFKAAWAGEIVDLSQFKKRFIDDWRAQ